MGGDARVVEAWLATVSRVEDDCEVVDETELVTISREDGRPIIELTDGTRIECVERAA